VSLARLQEVCTARGRLAVTGALAQSAAAGMQAYAQGGNAFDAALAACFVETVALPMKCGLGGDVIALFRVKGGPVQALFSVGPGAASLASNTLEKLGPKSVGVPGAPDGYATLHGFARLSLAQLVKPAVAAARHGVWWTRTSLSYLPESRELLQKWSPDCVYLQQSEPKVGDRLHLPGLGDLLEQFAQSGALLWHGAAGAQLVSELRARGGFLTEADLQVRPAKIVEPRVTEFGNGRRLYATPAPTHGGLLGDVLQRLLQNNEEQAKVVAEMRAAAKAAGRDARDQGTSLVTAADDEGNAVVIVHSNSFPRFGSGIVLSNGLVLNNRPGRGFDLQAPAGSATAPGPGKMPPTTLHAWALQDEHGLTFGGTPGGVNQLPWNVQSLSQLLQGLPLAEVVTSPRWATDEPGNLSAEPGAAIDPARSNVKQLEPLSLRSVQQFMRIRPDGSLEAAADPRTNAQASAAY
jgi:gamma-glutamyltranspeptidase/glutathione hydrolase